MSTQVPPVQFAYSSHVAAGSFILQGSPSAMMIGQVPLSPTVPLHGPFEQSVLTPSHSSPVAPKAIFMHVPNLGSQASPTAHCSWVHAPPSVAAATQVRSSVSAPISAQTRLLEQSVVSSHDAPALPGAAQTPVSLLPTGGAQWLGAAQSSPVWHVAPIVGDADFFVHICVLLPELGSVLSTQVSPATQTPPDSHEAPSAIAG